MINVFVIKQRVSGPEKWKRTKEMGTGDVLIVLGQDRWVRFRGELPDVKRVTASQKLRDENRTESLAIEFATLLVYAAAGW